MADEPNAPGTPPAPSAAATAARPAPAAAKPAAAKPPAKGKKERRFFLLALVDSWFAIGWTGLTLSLVGMLLGTVRFLFPNVLSEPPSKIKVGTRSDYEDGKVVERFKPQGVWVVRYNYPDVGDVIYALSTTCTHLGCTPNWLEGAEKFKCPCHGSGFRITGVNFEGPAPRPLERYAIKEEGGELIVDKSRKFQKELGQWSDPDSYVNV